MFLIFFFFFFQAEDGIRDLTVTGVQTCALPISSGSRSGKDRPRGRSGHTARSPEGPWAATNPAPGQGAGPAGRTADPPTTQDERPGLPRDPEKLGARSDRRRSEERRVGKECRSR